MARSAATLSDRKLLESVLTPAMVKEVWTANYAPVFPFTLQDFSVGGLLPAILYMFRRGHRRGQGSFVKAFPPTEGKHVHVTDVASTLLRDHGTDWLSGFSGNLGSAVLSDLLLAMCLENVRGEEGRNKQIIRAFPTHYFASWIDLPPTVSHLRSVPEAIVALFSYGDGPFSQCFSIGDTKPEQNRFLSTFAQGVEWRGRATDRGITSETYDEETSIGIDQLLTVRIAQSCGSAPDKIRGMEKAEIPKQLPIAGRAADTFREDLGRFLVTYGAGIPRQSLLPMLECGISLGLANVCLSSILILEEWERSGTIVASDSQTPLALLVDCSVGTDPELRRAAEASMQDVFRRFERITGTLTCMRILDYKVRNDRKFKADRIPEREPHAGEWLEILGSVFHEKHPHADRILDGLEESCSQLEFVFREAQAGEATALGVLQHSSLNPVRKLSEFLLLLMGDSLQGKQLMGFLSSCFLTDHAHGWSKTRRVTTFTTGHKRGTVEARSLVLSNTGLDYLVHLSLCDGTSGTPRPMSFSAFLKSLSTRYGIFVDEAPPGLTVSRELLLRNRHVCERRLRDLGVLRGVNDAESMKLLIPRFQPQTRTETGK